MSLNSDVELFIKYLKREGFDITYQTSFLIKLAYERGYKHGVGFVLDVVEKSSEYDMAE